MSEYADIEVAIVARIRAAQLNGAAAFAVVEGAAAADRKSTLAAIARLGKPTAVVLVEGRERGPAGWGAVGSPRVTVLVAGANPRSPAAARLGDVDGPGVYALVGAVTAALEGAWIDGARRLVGVDEKVLAADERSVVIEQHWLVERPAAAVPPTYGGETITGPDAEVSVEVGRREAATVAFGFPGIDGVFLHVVGAQPRTLRWTGRLRGAGHAELNEIEAHIEALVGDGRPATVADALGRSFPRCAVTSFARRGARQAHPVTGAVLQEFDIIFEQLAG